MKRRELDPKFDAQKIGEEMHDLLTQLYPICRSITGDGVRKTLDIVRTLIPLEVREVPSGTEVFDWTVPKEWNIRDAYVKNSKGERIIDFRKSNLHVLNYSIPVHKRVTLAELQEHLYTDPDHPEWIPYRTSYYAPNWGFCLSHHQFTNLEDDTYEVCIDSSLEEGSLTYGEFYIEGQTSEEILISTHICHPSLCNDNLSGLALSAFLARYLSTASPRYSLRVLFLPSTIGAITWLSQNETTVLNIKHGLVLACLGDSGGFTYKKSRRGDAEIDRVVQHVLKHSGREYEIQDFSPYGYDERQFCSPGFNLPVGSFSRTPYGQFPEYHTSADNPDFVRQENLADSFTRVLSILNVLNNNETYLNRKPKCEPQLGQRGLYNKIGGTGNGQDLQLAMLWVLNLSDGDHSLLDVAERGNLDFGLIREAANKLQEAHLLRGNIG